MFGKKRLFILAGLAVFGFGAAFLVSTWLGGASVPAEAQGRPGQTLQKDGALAAGLSTVAAGRITAPQKELEELIKEVRHKIALCRQEERQLGEQQKRIAMAENLLKEQARELERLRIQLVAPLNELKKAQQRLRQSRVRITKQELANLKRIAKFNEKKDPAAAAETLVVMCKNKQYDDAVKILYFMSERSAGKVLSEMTDRELEAQLYQRMKLIEPEG